MQEDGIDLFEQSHLQKVNTSAVFGIALQQFLETGTSDLTLILMLIVLLTTFFYVLPNISS